MSNLYFLGMFVIALSLKKASELYYELRQRRKVMNELETELERRNTGKEYKIDGTVYLLRKK